MEVAVFAGVDGDGGAGGEVAGEELAGERVFDLILDGAAQGSGAVDRVEAGGGEMVEGGFGNFRREAVFGEAAVEAVDLQLGDGADLLAAEWLENHEFIDAVDEFRREMVDDGAHDGLLELFMGVSRGALIGVRRGTRPAHQLLNAVGAKVGGHDDDGVAEIDCAAVVVGEAAVVEDLQQHVEDFGVGFFNFVEQHNRIGPAAHGLGELAALLVADVAGWRADQPRHRVPLHVFRHVDADHGLLGVEEEFRKRLAQLGLADTGGAEEKKGTIGAAGVGKARARAAHGVGDGGNGFILADHAAVERGFHFEQALAVALQHLAHWNAGGAGQDIGDFRIGDAAAHEFAPAGTSRAGRAGLGGLAQFLFEFRNHAVLDFRHAREIAGALGGFEFDARLLQA